MGAEVLSSRAIIGNFYTSLEATASSAMALRLGMVFNSDQASEDYGWLGAVPQLSEWRSGRVAAYLRDNEYVVRNVHYETTIGFKVHELRRDKTPQTMARINDLALRTNTHWNKLVSGLIAAGHATVCYDGQYFFDTDHAEGESGTQSNDVTVDISAEPASVAGSPTKPSVEEASAVIQRGIEKILGFKDDRGEPMNEEARRFEVVVPTTLFTPFNNAASMAFYPSGGSNALVGNGFTVDVTMDARSAWTDTVAVFRTDGMAARPFILQEEDGVSMKVLGEGSDHEFKENEHLYGVDAWRGAGYGLWQHACRLQMT